MQLTFFTYSKTFLLNWFTSLCAVLNHSVMSDSLQPHGLWPVRLFSLWDSPGKNSGVGCHALLQGIFPTQGLNPCLPHCRRILYCLSYQGSPWLSLLHHKNLSSQPHYSHQHINIYFTCEKNKIFDYTYPSTNPPSPPIFWFLFPQISYQYLSKLTTSTSSLIISLTHS